MFLFFLTNEVKKLLYSYVINFLNPAEFVEFELLTNVISDPVDVVGNVCVHARVASLCATISKRDNTDLLVGILTGNHHRSTRISLTSVLPSLVIGGADYIFPFELVVGPHQIVISLLAFVHVVSWNKNFIQTRAGCIRGLAVNAPSNHCGHLSDLPARIRVEFRQTNRGDVGICSKNEWFFESEQCNVVIVIAR